jgi:large conductance mechanosensitive channel
MLKEFRAFILRGNLVDLAVAVVIGAAFGAVVTSLVENLITPLIAAVAGKPDFDGLSFTINGSRFRYGDFLNALVSFLLIASVVFFLVIKPVNAVLERFSLAAEEAAPSPSPELTVLEEIRDLLRDGAHAGPAAPR